MKYLIWKALLSLTLLCSLGGHLLAQDLDETRRKRKPETQHPSRSAPSERVEVVVDMLPLDVDSLFRVLEQQLDQLAANTPEGVKALSDARNALANARRRVGVRRYESETKGVIWVEIRTGIGKALKDAARELRFKADRTLDAEAQQILRSAADLFEQTARSYPAKESIEGATFQVDIDEHGASIRINKSHADSHQTDKDDDIRPKQKDDDKIPDSTRYYKTVNTGLAGFNLGLNTWTHKGNFNLTGQLNDLELKQPNSVEYTLLLFPTRIRLGHRSKWHLLTSANLLFQNYKFQERLTLEPRTPDFVYRIDPDRPLDRNKLSMTYLQLPLQLMYASDRRKPREGFRIAAGPYVSYMFSAHTKQREVGNRKVRVRDDFNLDRFQYGIGGRIGYSWFELYVNYGLSELFESVSGAPSLRSFSLGLRII